MKKMKYIVTPTLLTVLNTHGDELTLEISSEHYMHLASMERWAWSGNWCLTLEINEPRYAISEDFVRAVNGVLKELAQHLPDWLL
jgi:UDP-2,3-diacylglucosamine pyrophosphatase LpxH